ncbi:hypothetical protein T492DRAFT_277550 [Pavlovales sp. CCMP2436]|nr:hypothetical protein T492DRAFT_277550 [Pavlovales sp. CCMP2436]
MEPRAGTRAGSSMEFERQSALFGKSDTCGDGRCMGGVYDNIVNYSASGHVTKYDIGRIHRFGFLRVVSGTMWEDSFLWAQTLSLLAFSHACSYALTHISWSSDFMQEPSTERAEELRTPQAAVNNVLMPLHSLASFLLALFVGLVLQRWHTLRMDHIGGFYTAGGNICTFVGNVLAGSGIHLLSMRRRTLRYILLAMMLLFKEANNDHYEDGIFGGGGLNVICVLLLNK